MFNNIKSDVKTKELLNKIFDEENEESLINLLDELDKINKGKGNGLTGKRGNAINAFLFAYAPLRYLSVVSLNDRKSIIGHFNFENGPDFDRDSWGRKIILSNKAIIEGFKTLGINANPRIVSLFLYRNLKPHWKPDIEPVKSMNQDSVSNVDTVGLAADADANLFAMEKHLEDFLVANWENTIFSNKYELINDEDGELISPQYPTGIGPIDLLVKDKENGQYVVIELKRGQTSDATVGQLLRYRGWVKDNLNGGERPHGIIIAASSDNALHYAMMAVDGTELYTYQINFTLIKAEISD